MAKVLKMFHLAQQDGVAQVQIGRGGVEAGLHAQGPTLARGLCQPFAQILFTNDLGEALFEIGELFVDGEHGRTKLACQAPPIELLPIIHVPARVHPFSVMVDEHFGGPA